MFKIRFLFSKVREPETLYKPVFVTDDVGYSEIKQYIVSECNKAMEKLKARANETSKKIVNIEPFTGEWVEVVLELEKLNERHKNVSRLRHCDLSREYNKYIHVDDIDDTLEEVYEYYIYGLEEYDTKWIIDTPDIQVNKRIPESEEVCYCVPFTNDISEMVRLLSD